MKTENSGPRRLGYFASYETSDLHKTLANLRIDQADLKKKLVAIVSVRQIAKDAGLLFGALEEALNDREAQVNSRTGYTNGLARDAEAELEARGEMEGGF